MSEIQKEVPKARIVIADDDVENAKIVEQGLKEDGHHIRVVGDGEAALHMVRSWSPHIVLLDINMPKVSGTEVLKKIRSLSGTEYIGVLLVTGNSDLDQIVGGLDAGADDYIVKPYRLSELRARVRACLRIKGLHDSLRRVNKRLDDISAVDELTSLPNMRVGLKRLMEEVEKAKKAKTSLGVVLFDMDNFRTVNQKQDHFFGSHVLREVAQIIQPMLRPTDIAARYGGDEFFIAMPGTTIKEAFELAERMRKSIEAHVFKAGAYSTRVTASFGVAGTQGSDDISMLDARELLRSVDAALFGAKNAGRNKTESFSII